MATKTVNVVYKVDDSALNKAKATIDQTAAATKAAEQAMGSYGATVTKSGLVISQNLEGQRLQMAQLKAQIDLTKQSDTARLDRLKADYIAVKEKADAFQKSIADINKTGESSLGIFQSLGTTIGAIFSVAAIKQVTSMYIEMNKLAGQVQGVDIAFKRAFSNSTALLEQLRKSTHGTVTDFELMKRTLQATNLGVSVEHLGVLFEFAAARAQQTGESVDYLVDSIVRGIGRKSILVLDNLGLSATRLREQFGGAAIASKSVGEVTAGVAEIAKVELSKMGGYIETSATKVAQLDVAWESLKQTIAKNAADSETIGFWTSLIQLLDKNSKGMAVNRKEAAELDAQFKASAFFNTKKSNEDIFKEIDARSLRRAEIEKGIESIKTDKELSLREAGEKRTALEAELAAEKAYIDILHERSAQNNKDAKVQQEQVGLITQLTERQKELNTQLQDAKSHEEIARINKELAITETRLNTLKNFKGTNLNPIGKDDIGANLGDVKVINRGEGLSKMYEVQNEDILKEEEQFNKDFEGLVKQLGKDTKEEVESQHKEEQSKATDNANALLRIEEDKARREKAIKKAVQDFALNSLDQVLTFALINRDQDTQDLNDYYQAQLDAAGDNEKAKKQIQQQQKAAEAKQRQQQLEQDREDAITKIEIDTAINIIRSILNNGGIPFGLPFGALAAAAGAIQIATIKHVSSRSLATRAFAKGEVDIDGPGPRGVDSINALIAPGESVINHQATAASRNLLEAINDRKIDDSILSKLAHDGGSQSERFDDSRLVKAVLDSRVDFAEQGYTLYKVQRKGENFRRRIRSKVQGY